MTLPDTTDRSHRVPLAVSLEEQWTLHHVLLDRIEREATAAEPTAIDPPSLAVFQAFERLDAGETSFTVAQLEAIRAVLTEYRHATGWAPERARLEHLLECVTELVGQHRPARLAD